jgi:hypothetical protein
MATKVTNEDILRINELYYKHKTYAEVARQTGFSASTVKKYVIKDWAPINKENISQFDLSNLVDFEKIAPTFHNKENLGEMCVLTECEQQEIRELWKELPV